MPDAPIGVPESFEEHVALMFDLLALAYEANLTRVFTFMMTRDASQRVYPNIGVTEPHHAMSHHGNNPEKIAGLVKLNTYHMTCSRSSSKKLAVDAGRRRLAARSLDDPLRQRHERKRQHSRLNIPTLLAGGLCGTVEGNRHIQAPKETPFSNLLLSIANKFGCEMDKFGLSTGRVAI